MPSVLQLVQLLFVCLISHQSISQVVPDCPDRGETVCLGHSTSRGTSTGSTVSDILENAYNRFCGCRYIQDNVAIQTPNNLPDFNEPLVESNFSFLYHVKEISGYLELLSIPSIPRLSLPNLRIIRGNTLRSIGDSENGLVIAGKIRSLYIPNLTEITRGSVYIFGDRNEPALCNIRSVNWTDIAPSNSTPYSISTDGCSNADYINCTALGCGSGFCWCNDSNTNCCQSLSFNCECNGGRCLRNGQTIQCCNAECAAGCSGGGSDQCKACKSVVFNGTCMANCPEEFIIVGRDLVRNPDFRLEAKPLCVVICPPFLFQLNTRCVENCPPNHMSVSINGTMRCISCDGVCPQECPGGIFDFESTTERPFSGCTIVRTSLRIGSVPVNINPSILHELINIQEIRGSLDISSINLLNFPYLSNLRTVGSDSNEVRSLTCNDSNLSVRSPYAINIADTMLESIDLSSLKEVNGGGVRLVNNPSLCYLGNLTYYIINTSVQSCIMSGHRRSEEDCKSANLTCHEQCSPERGWCWGPNDTQCVTCNNFLYEGQCVPTCNDFPTLGRHLHGMHANRTCLPCHPFCNGSCFGKGPDHCNDCKTNFFVRVNSTGKGIRCLDSCLTNTYLGNGATGECIQCFEGCVQSGGCGGPGRTLNATNGCKECNAILLDSDGNQEQCQLDIVNCPDGYYREHLAIDRGIFPANTVLCHSCHELCATCTGPGISNCTSCSLLTNSSGSCVSWCNPQNEFLPSANATRCDLRIVLSDYSNIIIGLAVGGILLAGLIVILIVSLIFCGLRLWRKSDDFKGNFNNSEKMELSEITIEPPKVPPNTAQLQLLSEDELEFGRELGSGAFGTVYEGCWKSNDTNYHVAIKVLQSTSPSAGRDMLKEGVVMASMDHENIVRLYGICLSKQVMLVSQYVPLGSLLDYLRKHTNKLSAETILLFSLQIAKGMNYLESKHLVHRDLAARNILVQDPVTVKITDFGLSRIIESHESQYEATTSKIPFRWLPPESFRHGVFTHKSDVWSFGVTIWEILTFGDSPYQGISPLKLLKLLEEGQRLTQPLSCSSHLYSLLLSCWSLEADMRPVFKNLVSLFEDMLQHPYQYVTIRFDLGTNECYVSTSIEQSEMLTYSYVGIDKSLDVERKGNTGLDKDGYVDCIKEEGQAPLDKEGYVVCFSKPKN